MDSGILLKEFEEKIGGVLGVVVGTPEEKIAELHSREVFPAASLIKIPVLVHLLGENDSDAIDLNEAVVLRKRDKVEGSGVLLELHDEIRLTLLDLATLMIVVSDNTATNILIDRLGMREIQKKIKKLGLRNTVLGRKLMVAPADPPANFTTPSDMFLLLKKLALGEILSSRNTRIALGILFRQQYNEKIPLFLPRHVKVAHKTGEISAVRHDCGMIQDRGFRWIACLLTKDVPDELKADRGIAELALALYKAFFRRKRGKMNGK